MIRPGPSTGNEVLLGLADEGSNELIVQAALSTPEGEGPELPPSAPGLTPSLHANFLWMLAGNVVYALCQWGMLIALVKLGSAVVVGQFALGLAICTPILMFSNLQLRALQATDAKRDYGFEDYLGLRLGMTVIAALAIVLVTAAGRFQTDTTKIILAVAALKSVETASDLCYGLFQREERLDIIATSLMLRGIVSLAALVTIFMLTGSVLFGLYGMTVVWTLVLLAYDARWTLLLTRGEKPLFQLLQPLAFLRAYLSSEEMRVRFSLVKLAFPLGLVTVLISLNVNIPRYFVHGYMNEKMLGIFSALAYPVAAIATVVDALGQSAMPRLAKYYYSGQIATFRRVLFRLISIATLCGAAGITLVAFAGAALLSFMYKPEYAEYSDVFVYVIAGAAVSGIATLLTYSLTSARHFKSQVGLYVLVAITSALGCWLLIPRFGMQGAAYATVIASLVHLTVGSGLLGTLLRRRSLSEGGDA